MSENKKILTDVEWAEYQALKAQKPTAPASRERLAHCPTCMAGIHTTERRIDGDSICFNGHKHPTKDFYRPTPVKTDGALVEELREWRDALLPTGAHGLVKQGLTEILSRHATTEGEEGFVKWLDDQGHYISKNSDGGLYSKGMATAYWAARDELRERRTYIPAPEVEPLAVLADRKGFHCVQTFKLSDGTWTFHIDGYKIMFHEVFAPTYADCEAKTRQYLDGLTDKKEGV